MNRGGEELDNEGIIPILAPAVREVEGAAQRGKADELCPRWSTQGRPDPGYDRGLILMSASGVLRSAAVIE